MKLKSLAVMAGAILGLAVGQPLALAQDAPRGDRGGGQGRGNFDPAQMQQRMMERYREQMEVKNDDEWKLIETRIQKVQEARRQMGFGGGMGMAMFARGNRPGGDAAQAGGGDDPRARRGMRAGETSPEAEALQKAIEAKASNAELKAALEKYTQSRKDKQASLEKAQAELRKVLSVRQEAIATVAGLL